MSFTPEISEVLYLLADQGLMTRPGVDRALQIRSEKKISLSSAIIQNNLLSEKRLYDFICDAMGMNPVADYSEWTYNLAGLSIPRFDISGDFFGFHPLDEGLMAITLCDVSGKGPEAGLLALLLANLLRTSIRMRSVIPSTVVRKLNRAVDGLFGDDQFAAFETVVLNMYSGTVEYSSAGTPPILVYRRRTKEVEELKVTGIPIGIYNDFAYRTGYTILSRGDVMLLYSDGAYEVENKHGRMFGIEGLKESMRDNAHKDAKAIVSAIKRKIQHFSMFRGLNDDTTLVVAKKMGRHI